LSTWSISFDNMRAAGDLRTSWGKGAKDDILSDEPVSVGSRRRAV